MKTHSSLQCVACSVNDPHLFVLLQSYPVAKNVFTDEDFTCAQKNGLLLLYISVFP